jgi:hypothetical protein
MSDELRTRVRDMKAETVDARRRLDESRKRLDLLNRAHEAERALADARIDLAFWRGFGIALCVGMVLLVVVWSVVL